VATTRTSDAVAMSFAENVCLAVIVAGAGHGWAVVRELAVDGDVGRIWQLSSQLTYRTIDQLHARGLIKRSPDPSSGARTKYLLAATKPGVGASLAWLATPVGHIRDVRLELLVKLTLRARVAEILAFSETDAEFLRRQGAELAPLLTLASSGPAHDAVAIFREESALAIDRFLKRATKSAATRHKNTQG
jgi:DNA-binding PadR family transcriptional regulator